MTSGHQSVICGVSSDHYQITDTMRAPPRTKTRGWVDTTNSEHVEVVPGLARQPRPAGRRSRDPARSPNRQIRAPGRSPYSGRAGGRTYLDRPQFVGQQRQPSLSNRQQQPLRQTWGGTGDQKSDDWKHRSASPVSPTWEDESGWNAISLHQQDDRTKHMERQDERMQHIAQRRDVDDGNNIFRPRSKVSYAYRASFLRVYAPSEPKSPPR